jgi:hypothetical protein
MTTYKFTVHGPGAHKVVQWDLGAVDPGKEYLRVQTGTLYPGSSITDFNPDTDSGFEVEFHSNESAVIDAIPVVGPVVAWVKGIFG